MTYYGESTSELLSSRHWLQEWTQPSSAAKSHGQDRAARGSSLGHFRQRRAGQPLYCIRTYGPVKGLVLRSTVRFTGVLTLRMVEKVTVKPETR